MIDYTDDIVILKDGMTAGEVHFIHWCYYRTTLKINLERDIIINSPLKKTNVMIVFLNVVIMNK